MLGLIIKSFFFFFKTTDIAQSDSLKKTIHQNGCGTEPCKYQFVFCVLPDCARMAALIQMWQNSLDRIIPTTWTRWSAAAGVDVLTQCPLLNPVMALLPSNAISNGICQLSHVNCPCIYLYTWLLPEQRYRSTDLNERRDFVIKENNLWATQSFT